MSKKQQQIMLISILVLVQFSAVVTILLSMKREAISNIEQIAQVSLDRLGDDVTRQIRQYLMPATAAITLSRDLIQRGLLDNNEDSELDRFFLSQLSTNPNLKGLYLGRPDGSFVYVSREGLTTRSKQIRVIGTKRTISITQRNDLQQITQHSDNVTDDYDPRLRPWYQRARSTDTLVWSDTYSFFTSKLPGITAAVSIANKQGNLAGVLGVDIDIGELSAYISAIPNSVNGTAAIIDEKLSIIAYSDVQKVITHSGEAQLPTLESVASLPIRRLFDRIGSIGNPFRSLLGGFSRINVNGQTHLALARPLAIEGDSTNWLLMVMAPVNDYHGSLGNMFKKKTGLLISIILLPGIIVFWIIAQSAKPNDRRRRLVNLDSLRRNLSV